MQFSKEEIHVIRVLCKYRAVSGSKKPKYVPFQRLLNPRIDGSKLNKALKELRQKGIVGVYKKNKTYYLIYSSKSEWEHVL